MGEAVGRPGAGARRAAWPAPGAAAGGLAVRGEVSTIAQILLQNQNVDRDIAPERE